MTDTNCLIQKPRCGLQAGNPVCAKCGLDTRATRYTSPQEGEEARSKALAAWEAADRKEQAELAELEQRKAQEKAETAQRAEQEPHNTQAAVQQPSNNQQAKGSSWWPQIASFVAVVVVLTGIRVYRQTEERHSQEIMQQTEVAMAGMRQERALVALGAAPATAGTVSLPSLLQVQGCAVCGEAAVIPAGRFDMGSNDGQDYEKPVHLVRIGAFELARTEVTQGQWIAVMGGNPSNFKLCGDNCPVEQVSWDDVQVFLKKLNQKSGKNFRLPSEAEWEYAARAGSGGTWSFGNDQGQLGEYAWYESNSNDRIHAVAQKKPNSFGLYDMYGNVWEWVEDVFHRDYQGAPQDGSAWVSDGGEGVTGWSRVLRGGSRCDGPRPTRKSIAGFFNAQNSQVCFGFRLARTL